MTIYANTFIIVVVYFILLVISIRYTSKRREDHTETYYYKIFGRNKYINCKLRSPPLSNYYSSAIRDVPRILFKCPFIFTRRTSFLDLIHSLSIPTNYQSIFFSNSHFAILFTLDTFYFSLDSKFKI